MLRCERLTVERAVGIYPGVLAEDFPPEERRPLEWIRPLMDSGRYRVFELYDGELSVAYAMVVQAEGERIWLMDFFAVHAPFRDRGYGSRLLAAVRSSLPDGSVILFEVDHPGCAAGAELEKRLRRLEFYRRNGVTDTGARTRVSGCEFEILCCPSGALTAPDALAAIDRLYHQIMPRDFYDSEIRLRPSDGSGTSAR